MANALVASQATLARLTKIASLALLASVLTCGCGRSTATTSAQGHVFGGITAPAAGSLLVYDPWSTRLVWVEPKGRREVPAIVGNETFQYQFQGRQDLYTSGSSDAGGWSLISTAGNAVHTILTVGRDESLFPLGYGQGGVVLLLAHDTPGGTFSNEQVVRLVGTTLTPLSGADHHGVFNGVVRGNQLYYTVFNNATQRYALRVLPLNKRHAIADTVERGLVNGRLAVFDGQLVNGSHVEGGGAAGALDCSDYCLFPAGRKFALDLTTDASGDLRVTALNPVSGKVFGDTVGDVFGFTVAGTRLTVYGEGFVRSINVPL